MRLIAPLAATLLLAACQNGGPANAAAPASSSGTAASTAANDQSTRFAREEFARFDAPWAMARLPDGRLLVSEKAGRLKVFDPATRRSGEIRGVPQVDEGGQGGLGDVVLHPGFADNHWLYFSYAEAGPGDTRGAVVARARLELQGDGGSLSAPEVIWRQEPKVNGRGHYSHRIAFAPDGHLFISSGDRQKLDPAQDMGGNLGKMIRLNDDGSLPADNPFAARGGIAAQVWTLGHRNVLGIAFDDAGRLWAHEMGPRDGDEFNLIVRGENYGWPLVSDGRHYNGTPIPDHATAPQYRAPLVSWTPVISPSSLVIYRGERFPAWHGRALIGGLSSKSLVVVAFDAQSAREVERFDMGERIRALAEDADGALWVLEDGENARLLKLTPEG